MVYTEQNIPLTIHTHVTSLFSIRSVFGKPLVFPFVAVLNKGFPFLLKFPSSITPFGAILNTTEERSTGALRPAFGGSKNAQASICNQKRAFITTIYKI